LFFINKFQNYPKGLTTVCQHTFFILIFTTDIRLSPTAHNFVPRNNNPLNHNYMENTINEQTTAQVITPEQFLGHYQGHRNLTRKVIEAFPEKEFFNYSIGGMRPFAAMVKELLAIAVPGLTEIVSGHTSELDENRDYGSTKADFLKKWDQDTEEINTLWKQLNAARFQENMKLFGQFEGSVLSQLQYFVDNEIHHRGQGYVYLRALDVEPPFFYDRS